ncbi:MAG: helix-turn-helix transcriptional regulator [Halanaerobiales bacterium]|nr:helix-turn-helix transcriptional regulator [Halanaerobiales bacterium]
MKLTARQDQILGLVKAKQPITSGELARILGLSRAAIRNDLSVLTSVNLLAAKPKKGYYYNPNRPSFIELARLFNLKCADIMSRPVLLNEEDSLDQAIITLFAEDKGTVCVVNQAKELIGIISRKDLLKICLGKTDLKNTPVSLAMTRMPNIVTVSPEDTYIVAARKIYHNRVDSLPVIKDKKVLGYISKTTITRTLVEFEKGKERNGES